MCVLFMYWSDTSLKMRWVSLIMERGGSEKNSLFIIRLGYWVTTSHAHMARLHLAVVMWSMCVFCMMLQISGLLLNGCVMNRWDPWIDPFECRHCCGIGMRQLLKNQADIPSFSSSSFPHPTRARGLFCVVSVVIIQEKAVSLWVLFSLSHT